MEIDIDALVNEPDGEPITFSAAIPAPTNSWLTLDHVGKKLYGTPPQTTDQNVTVPLIASDPYYGSVTVQIILQMEYNDGPRRDGTFPPLK